MDGNNAQVLSLLKLFNMITGISELLVEKGIFTKEEIDAKIEEVSIKSGNAKLIDRIETLDNIYTIISKSETVTEDDRSYIMEKAPGLLSDEDLQSVLTVLDQKLNYNK